MHPIMLKPKTLLRTAVTRALRGPAQTATDIARMPCWMQALCSDEQLRARLGQCAELSGLKSRLWHIRQPCWLILKTRQDWCSEVLVGACWLGLWSSDHWLLLWRPLHTYSWSIAWHWMLPVALQAMQTLTAAVRKLLRRPAQGAGQTNSLHRRGLVH